MIVNRYRDEPLTVSLNKISPAELILLHSANENSPLYYLDWDYEVGVVMRVPNLLSKRIMEKPVLMEIKDEMPF